ncbi:MAG: GNAT family N-acetyltransferase [Gemmatimonadaceae bacterium]
MYADVSFRVREARATDVDAIASLHVETFKEAHGGFRAPTHDLRRSQWQSIFDAPGDSFCYVAESPRAELVGFARGDSHDGGVPGFAGELDKIYVLREYHRQGLGKALVVRVAARFLDRGVDSMLLFGDARNPSNGFYERLGAERLLSPEGAFHGGYGWRDLRALVQAHG